MSRYGPTNPTGRPKAKINWKEIDELLMAGCSATEIADGLGLNYRTLYERCERDNGIKFADYTHNLRTKGVNSLRKKQYDVAMEGDKTMLVWLGKTRLKQQEWDGREEKQTERCNKFANDIDDYINDKYENVKGEDAEDSE